MKVVLIIDDDETIQEVLTDILEEEDYRVEVLSNTNNLEKILTSINPDCILMDVMLPGENGDVATKRIKQNNQFKKFPVILMSAGTDVHTKAIDCKADDYLKKPFQNDLLLQSVNKCVRD